MNGNTTAPSGSVETALDHAVRLLDTDPALAAQQASEILRVAPGQRVARLVRGIAARLLGRAPEAAHSLAQVVSEYPGWAAAHFEHGQALADAEQGEAALAAWRRAVALEPNFVDAWRAIADYLTFNGDPDGAAAAYAEQVRASTRDPRLLTAASALCRNDLPSAETLLRQHLSRYPNDVAALRMLAEVAGRLGRYRDAEHLLERCLELAPGFDAARYNYALVLNRQHKPAEAMQEVERLLAIEPRNGSYRNLRAVILAQIGDYAESIRNYDEILSSHPAQPAIWMSYGHALASAGREADSIAAYRRAIALEPRAGEAYWSLANLKTFRFTEHEVDAVRAALVGDGLTDTERAHFEFALGKALEDRGEHEASFNHYAAGNRLRRATVHYDASDTTEHVARSRALLTATFFAEREGFGLDAADPIFIVGLPRAGSTLVEQILASHSAVEGTAELPYIISIARSLSGRRSRDEPTLYPEALAGLTAADCRALGEQYLTRAAVQRKTAKRRFIDKMPNNFLHIALIRLILPNARIIDARRHPLACCWSAFKQHFASGQNFSYSLTELGRYYADYVQLMGHIDATLPGAVHRVIYESMVDDTEGEVARLLDYCGLPFEPSCLRFYENRRAVRTASSQQVRKPIYREGLDQWRRVEPWLGPLKEALGPVLTSYPEAPPLPNALVRP